MVFTYNQEYHNGCADKKCPCRLWVNCLHYIDMKKQMIRLKKKELNEYYKPHNDWYTDNFKISFEMGFIANG